MFEPNDKTQHLSKCLNYLLINPFEVHVKDWAEGIKVGNGRVSERGFATAYLHNKVIYSANRNTHSAFFTNFVGYLNSGHFSHAIGLRFIFLFLFFHLFPNTFMFNKKLLVFSLLFSLLLPFASFAQQRGTEGMWLPVNVKNLNYKDMKTMGFKLGPDEVYSNDKSSLKDVIVRLNGGMCTCEIISSQGLMLSNHHCAYDGVASLSTVERDFLTDGFWAKSLAEEIPIPGAYISLLVKSEDVTEQIVGKDKSVIDPTTIEQNKQAVIKKYTEGTNYTAQVKDMFGGLEYYVMLYEDYKDIRLVGVPPSSIGKFGGDTDNWMWPRHTGDFSMMRIYADKDNKPAEYSKDNVPFKPKKWLPISLKGVKDGDYTMIMGYPGNTTRYLTSRQIQFALDQTNNDRYGLMDQKLKIMKKYMDKNDTIRIGMAADYASLANYWKYIEGQNTMLKRHKVADIKAKEEAEYKKWAKGKKYETVLDDIAKLHEGYNNTDKFVSYLNFGIFGPKASVMASQFNRMLMSWEAKPDDKDLATKAIEKMKPALEEQEKEFFPIVDKDIMAASILSFIRDIPKDMQPEIFGKIMEGKGANDEEKVRLWVNNAYATSIVTNRANMKGFFERPALEILQNDPLVSLVNGTIKFFRKNVAPSYALTEQQIDNLSKLYIEGLREMHKNKKFYPDANSSMRVTYGKVASYYPRDGVFYDYYTTLDGVIEKEDNTNDEFKVPAKLHQLWERKDFGQYALPNGKMPVCFLTTNDITGGNSGSPVINGNGEIIGCAFDGNWEAMAGDIYVFPNYNRTIAVDIRYVLFVVEKFAGATNIIKELEIRK